MLQPAKGTAMTRLVEFHAVAFLFFCVLYAPFAMVDWIRKRRHVDTALESVL